MHNRFFDLFEHSPFIFHSIDENGNIVHVSNRWLHFFGYTREEVIGKKSTFLLTEESKKYAEDIVLPEFFKNGECDSIQYQYIKKDGSTVDMLLSAVVSTDIDGKKYSIALLTDITDNINDQKELEIHRNNLEELVRIRTEELHIAMDMYRTLARTCPVGIMRTDRYGKCEFVNQEWTDMTGQTQSDAAIDGWLSAIHEFDRDKVKAILDDAVANNKELTEEFRLINDKNEITWVLCSGDIVNGGNNGHVITFTNITKRKEILPQLMSLQKTMKDEAIKRNIRNGG